MDKIDQYLDGSEFGHLKVRLFVFLNNKYVKNECALDQITDDAVQVFQSDDVIPLVKEWKDS